MNNFTEQDYKILLNLLNFNQKNLKKFLGNFLKTKYDKVICEKDFIAAEGTIPIVLIAHLDTVFKDGDRTKGLLYDKEKNIMINPFIGAGFDDRCGVFAILKIIGHGYRPHIIFTTNEETTGDGARAVAENPNIFSSVNYIIELDRQGEKDCVFYRCNNIEFMEYVESFGFDLDWGTFTDISIICPAWGIAGVNLSVGYINEHDYSEFLRPDWLMETIDKVEAMLSVVTEQDKFKYIPSVLDKFCTKCRTPHTDHELMSVIDRNGSLINLCLKCLPNTVQWCEVCQSLYIPEKNYNSYNGKMSLCYNCKKEVDNEFSF